MAKNDNFYCKMESKILFAVVSLLTVGLSVTAPNPPTSTKGLCDSFMTCLKPRMDDILTWRNAMDLFEFDVTLSADGVKKACDISKEMATCLKTKYDRSCVAGLASFMILSKRLMEETCKQKDTIKKDLKCWTNKTLNKQLRKCYRNHNQPLDQCQRDKITRHAQKNGCRVDRMTNFHSAVFKIYKSHG